MNKKDCIHDWVVDGESERKLEETCKLCGKFMRYYKIDGGVDNVEYLKNHVRDFCQPYGPTSEIYRKVYGTAALNASRRVHEAKANEKQGQVDAFNEGIENVKEALKFWKHAEGRGFTDREIMRVIEKI